VRPVPEADGHDFPRPIDELLPGVGAVIDDLFVGTEHPVREPIVTHELPDVFLRIEFGAFRRDWHYRDIGRKHEFWGQVPTGLVHEEHRVSARRNRQ